MTFVGNKTGDKETIHHYLPSASDSYIVFEIFKHRYYSILLKRNNDGELEYYKFDHEYRDDFFVRTENNQQIILKFEEFRSRLIESGIILRQFKDKREVFSFVYQRGKKSDGVVWLESDVINDGGLSNNFSKIYRYLINSKLITNQSLKESLIIANNRDKEGLNFSQKSKKDINDLLKVSAEIKVISSIQKEFSEFREVVRLYNAKRKILSELVFAFNQQYSSTIVEVDERYYRKKKEISDTSTELNEILLPRKQQFDREIGGKEEMLRQTKEQQSELDKLIKEIKALESIDFLNECLANLDERRLAIETKISSIQARGLSVKQIETKIASLQQALERLEGQIKDFSNQLIHKITDKHENREILNFILSPDFSGSVTESIKGKIDKIDSLMLLFDGKIQLPTVPRRKEIPSLETLEEDLISTKKEMRDYEALLPVARDLEAANNELKVTKQSIKEIEEKIRKVESRPSIEEKQGKLVSGFTKLVGEKESLEKNLRITDEEINRKTESVKVLTEDRDKLDARSKELRQWKEEVEKIPFEPIQNDSAELLSAIYSKIKLHNGEREGLKASKELTFERLKNKLNSTLADEDEFVKFVEEEIACLADKQKSIETILQAISRQFANPAHLLVKRYGEFKEFIINKFNHKLARTSISDIEALKIVLCENERVISDLRKISSIEEFSPQISFDFDKAENLKVLNSYLDSGKKIEFEELFDIELHLTKDGKEKKVDLKEQVESTGTDIVIRLVIIMSVINRLAINDTNNKIAIAIDEIARVDGKNRVELFKFCKEHNFIPICTSTDETMLDGFDKYILLFRPQKGKKARISEASHNVVTRKMLEGNEGA